MGRAQLQQAAKTVEIYNGLEGEKRVEVGGYFT